MIDYLYNPDFWKLEFNLTQLSCQSWFITLVVAIVFERYDSVVYKRILAFAFFTLLMEHLSTDVDLKYIFRDKTNSPWYHLLTPFLFLLMTRFFADYFIGGKLKWWLPLGFLLISILNAASEDWGDGFYNFPSIPVGIYCITGIILALNYFLHMLRSLDDVYLERNPMFWVSSGWLIYLSGSFLLWVGIRFITFDADFFYSIYRINQIVTILLNCSFIVAIFLIPGYERKKQTKSKT